MLAVGCSLLATNRLRREKWSHRRGVDTHENCRLDIRDTRVYIDAKAGYAEVDTPDSIYGQL